MAPPMLEEKYERLQGILRELGSVAVAFSAGVDSTFLLKVAIDALGAEHVVAVTGRSDSLARADLEQARTLAESLGAGHAVLDTDEFEDERYTSNPTNRCFFCKANLYAHLQRFVAERGFKAIVTGVNVDDLDDFRPGIEAGRERGVHAPVADAGLTKAEVRELSRRLGLPTFDKPASPCLASRVPYGEDVTPAKLRMIEAAETFLHDMGIGECRVRHHTTGAPACALARIEVPPESIAALARPGHAARIDEFFRSLGYTYVALDLRGFRSGSLNEAIHN